MEHSHTIRSDYETLLRHRSVVRELPASEHQMWRSLLRREARADGLGIRTGSAVGNHEVVWAVLVEWTPDRLQDAASRLSWWSPVEPRAGD